MKKQLFFLSFLLCLGAFSASSSTLPDRLFITLDVSTPPNYACTGRADVRPFPVGSPTNLELSGPPPLDPNSAAIVANLNSENRHVAGHQYGVPFFDGSVGTPRTIVCTEAWGTCPLSQQTIPIHPAWKADSSGTMVVIDYQNRKVYDFYRVSTNADGTVMINSNGTVTAAWGGVTDLDGNGQSPGSLLPDPFGTVRVFEMERAATDPANAIRHALAVTTRFACGTYRYPATKSDGTYTGTGCVPVGSRLYLDSTAACSTVTPAGEKALC